MVLHTQTPSCAGSQGAEPMTLTVWNFGGRKKTPHHPSEKFRDRSVMVKPSLVPSSSGSANF